MTDREAAWRLGPDGIELRVRAIPRGGRDAIDGIEALSDGRRAVKLRVRAAAEAGAANEAVRRLIAAALACPASCVRLAAGASSRTKTFIVAGDPAALAAGLERITQGRSP